MSEATIIGNEKETVKKLKRELESWREIILQLNSVLLWEKSWYPGVIGGVSSALFMLLWVLDPSLLSALSCSALIITLLDYLGPSVSASLFSPDHWTGAKEKQFENVCQTLVSYYNLISQQIVAFKNLKESSPKLYYSVTIASSAILAYIGNEVNNLLLAYIFVTTVLLMPGLEHHGILYKYYQLVLFHLATFFKTLKGGNKMKAN